MLRFALLAALLLSAAPASTELPAGVQARARREGARFRAGRRCHPEAFAAVGEMRAEYGAAGDVGKAAALAYRGCDDTLAYAELFEVLFAERGQAGDGMKLAAAWLRASRPAKAEAVLRSLAEAEPAGRSGWLLGYALFEQGRWEEARPWLVGARETVAEAVRSDAPIMLALTDPDDAAAIETLQAARAVRPEDPSLPAMLAYVQRRAGAIGDAASTSAAAKALARSRDAQRRVSLQTAALRASLDDAIVHGGPVEVLVERLRPRLKPEQVEAWVERTSAALEAAGRSGDAARVRSGRRR